MTDQTPSPVDPMPSEYATAATDGTYVAPGVPATAPMPPAGAPFSAESFSDEIRAAAKKAGAEKITFGTPQPQVWMAPYLGADGLPAGVARFNWGAMFLPFWWAFAYGMQRWAAFAFLIIFGSNQLSRFLPGAAGILLAVAQIGFSIWFGMMINKAYWAINPKMLSVEQFNRKQPKWIAIGALVTIGVYALIFSLSFQ